MNHKIWLLFGMVLIIASMAADGLPVNDTENKKAATAEPDHSDTKDKKVETEPTKPTTTPTKSRRAATTASPPQIPKNVADTSAGRSRRADQSTTTTSPLKGGTTTKQVPGRFKEVQAPTPPTTRSPLPKVASDRQRRDTHPTTTPKSTTKSGSGKHRRAATTPSPVKSGSDNKPTTPKSRWEASSTPSPTKSTIKKNV